MVRKVQKDEGERLLRINQSPLFASLRYSSPLFASLRLSSSLLTISSSVDDPPTVSRESRRLCGALEGRFAGEQLAHEGAHGPAVHGDAVAGEKHHLWG